MKKPYFSSPEMLFQGEVAECGLACATMLLNTLGENVTLADIRDKWGGGTGSSLDLLVNLLGSYGYKALPVKFDLNDIKYLPTPCILHYGGNHYVYVYSKHSTLFQVLNPATGRMMISAEELSQSATGYALILDDSLYKNKKNTGKLKIGKGWLETLTFPGLSKRCLLAIFLSLFGLITPMLFTTISKDQHFFENERINIIFSAMLFLFLAISLMQCMSSKYALNAALNAARKYNPYVFDKLLNKDISYFENRTPGDIKQRIDSIGSSILHREKTINDKYKSLIITLVTLTIMLWLDISLTLLSIITMATFGILSYYYSGKQKFYSKSLEESISDISTFNLEAINGIYAIKSGNLSTGFLSQYNKLLENSFIKYKKMSNVDIRQNTVFSLLTNVDLVLFLWIAFYNIDSLNISYSTVIAFYFFRKIAMDSINQFYQCCVALKIQKVSDERLQDMLSYKEIDITGQHRKINNSIGIKDIEFGYGPENTIFDSITIDISKGTKVAVIGESGTGKSTLLKLLAGLYTARKGNLIIDDQEIINENSHLFYSNMYYLPQAAIVFNATIYENVVWYSGGDANEHECRDILKKFGLLDMILSLPAGLYTKITPENPVLSSGQLQRLMLCRAMLSPKDVILLDEPTANLDDFNAILTFNSLLGSNKTIVLSTHDTNLLHRFDKVISLEKR